MSFWAELRRRNVFKVGAAYAVAAWLIAQVVALVSGPLDLPGWFEPAVIVFLAAGFPVAVLLAWAYEVTPQGIQRTKDVPLARSITRLTGQRLNYVVTGLLVLAAGFLVADEYLMERAPRPAAPSSAPAEPAQAPAAGTSPALPEARRKVAVLPCENLSPDEEDSYFAAGIHEEILNQLAKIRSLLVVARTSVMQYAEASPRPTVPQIAQELDANAIMECSVRYAGDDILVTAQLIDPATDSHLWSDTYPGNLSDLSAIFAMQADIAMNIANALEAEFSRAEQVRLGREATDSPAAYALFLEALAGGTPEARLSLLDQAVGLDPEFAPAHAAIAITLAQATANVISGDATRTWSEAGERALASARRALELDAELPLAHMVLGAMYEWSWRWPEARAEYERALALGPNVPEVLWRYSWFSAFSGEFERAIALAEREVDLRPNEPGALTNLSLVNAHSGDIGAAIRACERAVDLQPNAIFCQHALGLLYARRGDAAAAEAQFRLIEEYLGDNRVVAYLVQLALGYSMIGLEEDAARIVAELEALGPDVDLGAGGYATMHMAASDAEQALAWLERGVERRDSGQPDPSYNDLMNIKNNVYGHPLLDEPRFRDVRGRLGAL